MYSQVALLVGLVCASQAYPRTYQEQRQIYYSQPLPVPLGQYQLPQQQVVQYQLPASTSLLPNNVPGLRYGQQQLPGLRYGQQQVVYVVPGGGQLLFEEGSTGGQEGSQYLESFMNFLNGHLPQRPGAQAPEKPAEKPVESGSAENAITASQEQEGSAEQVTQTVEAVKQPEPQQQQPQLLQPLQQLQQQPQMLQQLQLQQQPQLVQQPQLIPQQSQQDQQLLQQQLLQRFYLYNQPQQSLFPRPAIAGPSANYLLNYRTYPLSDKRPGSSAIAFQKLLQKNAEAAAAAGNATENESAENDSTSEEIGPSIAQAKPQAVSVAGVGGVAAAAPVGTAIVGPGGMALSAPTATAVAGTKPKPGADKTKGGFLSRTNLYPF